MHRQKREILNKCRYFFRFYLILIGGLLFTSSTLYGKGDNLYIPSRNRDSFNPMEIALASTYAETNVPVEYLRGIVAWECGNDLSRNIKNKNGTIDHGPGLNSRWLDEFAWRFNDGKEINPHSYSAITIVGKILANNYKMLKDWDRTLSSYRWGVQGTIKYGIDRYYIDNVKRLGKRSNNERSE